MPASAVLTSIVQKALRDVPPNRMRAVESNCINVSDLNSASAAHAINAQHLAGDFVEPKLLDWQARSASRARIVENRIPPAVILRWSGGVLLARHLFELFGRGHAPISRPVAH
jgi:hypothetical protein